MKMSWLSSISICGLLFASSFARAELVAHFPLDADGNDASGVYEGDVNDSVSFLADGGVIGGAAEFEGFDGGIQIPYDEALNPEDAFSLTAWVNPSDTLDWNSVITSRSHAGDQVSGYIIYNTPNNEWDSWVGTGGPSGAWGRNIGPEAEFDEWTHLAVTYDGDDDSRILYVNGEEAGIVFDQGFLANPNNPVTIGAGGDVGTEFFFIGLIDEVSIWNETLDETAIQTIMEVGVEAFANGAGGEPGDFNADGVRDVKDIDALTAEILAGGMSSVFDANGDGDVDAADRTFWVETLQNSFLGDSNLDGEFNSSDFVAVFTAGEYEDATPGNSTWATGDWNGDGDFDSGDFVAAFTGGGFESGPRVSQAVPEPAGLGLFCIGLCGLLGIARRR